MDRIIKSGSHFLLVPLALAGAIAPTLSVAAPTASALQFLEAAAASCSPAGGGEIFIPPSTNDDDYNGDGNDFGDGDDNGENVVGTGNNGFGLTLGIGLGGITANLGQSSSGNQPRAAGDRFSASPNLPLCSQLTSRLAAIDRNYANDPQGRAAARAQLAAELTPDEVPALYTSLVQLSSGQVSTVSRHLRGLRQSGKDNSAVASRNGLQDYVGGSAGDSLAGRISLFAQGSRTDGSRDQSARETGYDLDTDHYTLGVDYRVSSTLIAGLAWGNSDTHLEYGSNQGRTTNKTDHYIVYSSWFRDNFAVDTIFGHASGDFDTQRHMLGHTATGNTDNRLNYLSIAGSYDFVEGALTYGTFASFDYLQGKVDGFEERNGGGWEMAFAKQSIKSQIYAMGVQGQYAASFDWGVLLPYARAEWRTELEDGQGFISGRFVQDPTSSFTLATDKPDSNWYQASTGATAQFAHGISAFVNYEAVLGYRNTDLGTLTAGIRWEL